MLGLKHHAPGPVNGKEQCVHAKGRGLIRRVCSPLRKAVPCIGPGAQLHGIALHLALRRPGAGKAGVSGAGGKQPQGPAAQRQQHQPDGNACQDSGPARGAPPAFSVCGQNCRLLPPAAAAGNWPQPGYSVCPPKHPDKAWAFSTGACFLKPLCLRPAMAFFIILIIPYRSNKTVSKKGLLW